MIGRVAIRDWVLVPHPRRTEEWSGAWCARTQREATAEDGRGRKQRSLGWQARRDQDRDGEQEYLVFCLALLRHVMAHS